jgi:hypothetical protein
MWGALSDERTGLSFTTAPGPRQRNHFLGSSPVGVETTFYCLRFETSLFVASYDSQGYGGGIRPRLHAEDEFLRMNYVSFYNSVRIGSRTLRLTVRVLCCSYLLSQQRPVESETRLQKCCPAVNHPGFQAL